MLVEKFPFLIHWFLSSNHDPAFSASKKQKAIFLFSYLPMSTFCKLLNFSRIERDLILLVPRKVVSERNISSRAISKREMF